MAQTTLLPATALLKEDGTVISPSSPLWFGPGDSIYASIGVALSAGIMFTGQRVIFQP